ncbi:hypothetical protein [Mixta calida]|uniref:hypothetical protein n=1 Tax=Mixta calida TaxID=665913 RepID=UPI0034D66E2F
MLAKIFPCQPAEPGFAQLMVRLRGEEALLSDLNFTLCNNEQYYLQPDGNWSPAPHTFTISGGYPFNKGSGFRIGPDLLDPLLASASQVKIQVQLASGENRNTTLQLVRDELFSSGARGQTANYGGSSVLNAPVVAADVPVGNAEATLPAEPGPASIATIPPARRKKSLLPIIVAVLLLLLIAAGALWWFVGGDNTKPLAIDTQPKTPTATVTQSASTGCSSADMASQSELDFVQSCVQQQLDSDKLLTVIQAAKEAKQCGVAQRLYANRAQSGDTKIALAYAGEYDPQNHQSGECFNTPDADTAIYWYETVLQNDPQNQKAKQRLEELKK